MTRRPADFPARTRRLIAERAGYLCSKPDCRRMTLGPGAGPHDVACIGVACHIYSAAPGGPRGTGGLTPDQLQSASNGIWLCSDHARLIDTSQGLGYPPPLLRGWRQLHEAYLAHEMRGLVPPCTLITEVNVRQGPTALQARPVALSALNIIIGPNSTGKSTLLNLLARAGQGDSLAHRPWEGHLAADIQWFDPQPHLLRFHDRNGDVEVLHDERRIPLRPAPYRAVTMRPPRHPGAGVDHWASHLGLDRHVFLMLLRELPRCVRGEVTQVDVTGEAPVVRLRSLPDPVRLDTEAPLGIAALVLFEAAIALAQMHSQKAPVLLLVDDFGDFLHPAFVRRLFTTLAGASRGFQTIVATHCTLPPEVRQEWTITPIGEDDCEHHIGVPLRDRSLATWANDIGC